MCCRSATTKSSVFLAGNDFTGKDLFDRAKASLQLRGGVLSVDDTVIDKPYSDPAAAELVDFFL